LYSSKAIINVVYFDASLFMTFGNPKLANFDLLWWVCKQDNDRNAFCVPSAAKHPVKSQSAIIEICGFHARRKR
jgi:hypothetical protein